jgi:hypothetical protein
MYPTDTNSPGPAMRRTRCHSGEAAEIRTLPRTSLGQNGAVALRGNLNMSLIQMPKCPAEKTADGRLSVAA